MSARDLQLRVHMVRPTLARALHVLVPHLVGGRLARPSRSVARLSGRQHAPNHIRVCVRGARAQRQHARSRRLLGAQQLAPMSTQLHRFPRRSHAHRHQVRLHLTLDNHNYTLTYTHVHSGWNNTNTLLCIIFISLQFFCF